MHVVLAATAFGFGFRHGIDWDHIAAITDITSSQEERRQALIFGTLYALGHASVVLVLGVLAILVGEQLPPGVDNVMTRIVGATLILLGVYVFVSLIRHGRENPANRWRMRRAYSSAMLKWVCSCARTRRLSALSVSTTALTHDWSR